MQNGTSSAYVERILFLRKMESDKKDSQAMRGEHKISNFVHCLLAI